MLSERTNPPRSELMAENTSSSARTATVVMAVIMVGAMVWWLRGILAPFALALFLMVIIDGLARVLRHRIPYFPKRAALPLAMLLTTIVFAVAAYVVADNASGFILQLIKDAPKLNGLIGQLGARFGMQVPATVGELVAQLNLPNYLVSVADALKTVASGAGLVFIYLIFLFLARSGFDEKAHLLFPTGEERIHAARIFIRIRTGVERYVWVQTITGIILASASWAIMALVGLDNAVFWAFLIFIAAYVPILGGAIGIMLPPIFALVQFNGHVHQALILFAGAEAIHFVVGNFVAPRMQGVTLNVDPVVVVLSLAFWGAIWGVPGMFLSTPLTVVAIVILLQFPQTHWIAVLLSRDGFPETYSEGSTSDPSSPGPPAPPPPPAKPAARRRNASVKAG